ncbi:MAG: Gfo/Idh/MocA family oxidoreductase [Lachnospiraceae bacterium]|nr:Gfo/Idh/MocA family oxidoreductase [Lachnospiraceae bacterium]
MSKEMRVVVIGFGGMGSKYAAILGAGQIEGMRLSGICCRNEAGQRVIREQYPQAKLYVNVEDAFAHADAFDAVLIVTPHATHVEIGKLAFAHGKHVLCDKPAGVDTKEVRELLAAKREDTAFAMMFNTRTSPAFREAKRLIEADELGAVTRAIWVCNNWFRSPAYHHSAPWRSSWKGERGGLLINQCQHYLDLWQWLFGMPDLVDADIDFGKYNDFAVDDSVDLRLLYRKKGDKPALRGSLISASGEHPGVNRLEIWGTRGKLTVDCGKTLIFDENLVDIDTFNRENTEIYGQPEHKSRVITEQEEPQPYVVMLQNFSDHLRTGEPLIAPGEDGLSGLMLANAAYLSAWTGQKIALPMDDAAYVAELAGHMETECVCE